jgi:catechol 2,3-dioxygenase-like lactoylglutathione lyase family enzyme
MRVGVSCAYTLSIESSRWPWKQRLLIDPHTRFAEPNVSTTKVTRQVLQTSFVTPPNYGETTHKRIGRLGGHRALVTGGYSRNRRATVQSQLNHIALHVRDIERASRFYTEILGFQSLRNDTLLYRRADNPDAPIFRIYDDDKSNEVVLAFLSTSDGIGLELFQFIVPQCLNRPLSTIREVAFHFAVTHSDPESLVKRVIEEGGKQIGETVTLSPGTENMDPEIALYFQDPWGNTIEAVSCTFEEMTTYVK